MNPEKLIILYFEDKLTAAQKKEFEDLLAKNEAFKTQFLFEKQVKKAIISSKKDSLKAHLHQIEQPKNKSNFYSLITVAASLIIFLGVFSFFFLNKKVNEKELFATYFKPYTNIITPTSRNNQTLNNTTKAFKYYDAKNYKIANEKFQQLYKETNLPFCIFYQAMCELQLHNTKKAIILLEKHKKYAGNLSEHNNWYLALAYLKNNNIEKSKKILEEIAVEKTYQFKTAKIILEKLN